MHRGQEGPELQVSLSKLVEIFGIKPRTGWRSTQRCGRGVQPGGSAAARGDRWITTRPPRGDPAELVLVVKGLRCHLFLSSVFFLCALSQASTPHVPPPKEYPRPGHRTRSFRRRSPTSPPFVRQFLSTSLVFTSAPHITGGTLSRAMRRNLAPSSGVAGPAKRRPTVRAWTKSSRRGESRRRRRRRPGR